ncbi:hypothetical protein F6B41_21950 [Microbacterium lushaniae]|nr:hypothetical protein F6B41_25305 [Microbacterium lushaniae]KAA9150913.1 hypothetical protein F6B41_21950 [Microbacterium lushaniae]
MSLHTFDLAELRELETALDNLITYCTDLETHAAGATAAANAQWAGVASVEFLGLVGTWQLGAAAIKAHAEDLKKWVGEAASVYEAAQNSNRTMWASA